MCLPAFFQPSPLSSFQLPFLSLSLWCRITSAHLRGREGVGGVKLTLTRGPRTLTHTLTHVWLKYWTLQSSCVTFLQSQDPEWCYYLTCRSFLSHSSCIYPRLQKRVCFGETDTPEAHIFTFCHTFLTLHPSSETSLDARSVSSSLLCSLRSCILSFPLLILLHRELHLAIMTNRGMQDTHTHTHIHDLIRFLSCRYM